MTIAAGFVHSGGVLLCADSEMEAPGLKSVGRKIGTIVKEWGSVACGIAGNVDYATCAFQALTRECDQQELDIGDIEEILSNFYKEHAFGHPHYASYPDSIKYSLLLAVQFIGEMPKLYVTNETILREVTTYRCEGIGKDVGHSVLKPLWRPDMEAEQVMRLGAYMLAIVKTHVPGCGGPSQFVNIPTLGFPGQIESPKTLQIENVFGWFDQTSSEFLLQHMCDSDEEFETHLSGLSKAARHIRELWKDRVTQANQEYLQSAKRGQ